MHRDKHAITVYSGSMHVNLLEIHETNERKEHLGTLRYSLGWLMNSIL